MFLPDGFSLISPVAVNMLSPMDSTTFTIQLDAIDEGSFAGEIYLFNGDSDESPFNFLVSGAVDKPEIDVKLGQSPITDGVTLVYYGNTAMGAPVPLTYTVENTGAGTLTLENPISVPNGFSVVSSFGSTTLAAGESTSFVIQLDDTSAGCYSGEVSFGNSDADEVTFSFYVEGSKALPYALVELGQVTVYDGQGVASYGHTSVGTPVTQTFTVKNSGSGSLVLNEPISVPAGYTVVSSFGTTTLASGASTTFAVRLDATSSGVYTGELSFGSNDARSPYNFTLNGEVATPDAEVKVGSTIIVDGASDVAMGDTAVGVTRIATFTVTNKGLATLTLNEPIAVPEGFTVASSFGSTSLEPSQTTAFTLAYPAATAGAANGQVSFTTNDPDETTYNFTISAAAYDLDAIALLHDTGTSQTDLDTSDPAHGGASTWPDRSDQYRGTVGPWAQRFG